MNKKDLQLYLFETRLIIEPEMAGLAAHRALPKNIDALEEAFENMTAIIKKGKNHTEEDIQFHNIIAKSTQNPIIQRIIPIINDSIKEGYQETKDIPQSGEKVITYHKMVLDAIKNKDSDGAIRHMREHILHGLQQIKEK